jgi:hypothetical protein
VKYLKIFESFDLFGGEYSEITVDEYDNLKGEMSHMTENDYSALESQLLLKGWELRYKVSNSWEPSESNSDVYEVQFRKTIGDSRESSLIITYMGDEWYYILLFKGGELRQGSRNKRVYKADQIEGLKKFIDEIL